MRAGRRTAKKLCPFFFGPAPVAVRGTVRSPRGTPLHDAGRRTCLPLWSFPPNASADGNLTYQAKAPTKSEPSQTVFGLPNPAGRMQARTMIGWPRLATSPPGPKPTIRPQQSVTWTRRRGVASFHPPSSQASPLREPSVPSRTDEEYQPSRALNLVFFTPMPGSERTTRHRHVVHLLHIKGDQATIWRARSGFRTSATISNERTRAA